MFQRLFAEGHAHVTGAVLVFAPAAIGIALFFLGADKYWLWNASEPLMRLFDLVWP
jgi:hypothetical protein